MLSSAQLSELWKRHSAALLLVAKGHCGNRVSSAAEDCVQEAFIKLAACHPTPDSPAAWLMTCVRTTAVDAIRSEKRRSRRETIFAANNAKWFQPKDFSDAGLEQELQLALKQLDAEIRDIMIGYLWNDMTFRQLAEVVELSPATVQRRYERGLEQLRLLMTPSQPVEEKVVP